MAARITTTDLAEALATLAEQRREDHNALSTLVDHVAKLSTIVSGLVHPAEATPKASAKPTAPKAQPKAAAASAPAEGRFAVGEMTTTRCPHVKTRADGTTRQCRQHLDVNGTCKWHGPQAAPATPKASAKAATKAQPKAAAADTPGGPYTYVGDATCKGVTKGGDPCSGHFLNAKGYCKHHHGQVKGRSKTAK